MYFIGFAFKKKTRRKMKGST